MLNEESTNKFLKYFQELNTTTNPKVAANRRLNYAQSEMKQKGGDFWEGLSKKEFFNNTRVAISKSNTLDASQKQFLLAVLKTYEDITSEELKVTSSETDTNKALNKGIQKENNKPVQKYNAKTGESSRIFKY